MMPDIPAKNKGASLLAAVPFVALLLLAGLLGKLSLASRPAAAAPADDYFLTVNFSGDWLRAVYEPGHTFTLTVTDSAAVVKAVAVVQTTVGGVPGPPFVQDGFLTESGDWDPAQPDIQPGDIVTFASDDGFERDVQVGDIWTNLNPENDVAYGEITAPWFAEGTVLQGDVGAWGQTFVPFTTTLRADGVGFYWVPFEPFDWPPDMGASVMYRDPPDTYVFMDVPSPAGMGWFNTNYTEDWVHATVLPGHTVDVTVTESDATTVKASLQMVAGPTGFHSNDGTWVPARPDIIPGDWVTVALDTGYILSQPVGEIDARIDVPGNRVFGTVDAPWVGWPTTVQCEPEDAVMIMSERFILDGEQTFACTWDRDTEWEMEAGATIDSWYCYWGACIRVTDVVGILYLPILLQ
jgi:hypothetical protein